VKHYSSGMVVRLGFSVAAHLEPEILVVDEVLAVGDAAFQKKCIGRMNQVARDGRTVLLVSHQMDAIIGLCDRALWINDGGLAADGDAQQVVREYLSSAHTVSKSVDLDVRPDRRGNGPVRLTAIELRDDEENPASAFPTGSTIQFAMSYKCDLASLPPGIQFNLVIRDQLGRQITGLSNRFFNLSLEGLSAEGVIVCELPRLQLMPGTYSVDYVIRDAREVSDELTSAASFEVLIGDYFGTGKMPKGGIFLADQKWLACPT
jgi:lipopolysaccharide transport system ATP-binding protein